MLQTLPERGKARKPRTPVMVRLNCIIELSFIMKVPDAVRVTFGSCSLLGPALLFIRHGACVL